MKASKKNPLIPTDDERCIWMAAGILTYRLCDHTCDCDDCPLDAAMRKHLWRHTGVAAAQPEGCFDLPAAPEALREGFRYARNHCWTRQLDACSLRVGIEPGLGAALLDPKAVVLPSIGQFLQQGQTCLWIVMEGGTLPIDCPCTGTVHDTNRQVANRPHLLHLSPFDEGWLYDLETENSCIQAAHLQSADQAGRLYGQDEASFLRLLGSTLRADRSQVGLTIADGGRRLQHLADLLSPAKYFSILRKVYGA